MIVETFIAFVVFFMLYVFLFALPRIIGPMLDFIVNCAVFIMDCIAKIFVAFYLMFFGPKVKCKVCKDTGNILGYGYRDDGGGGLVTYDRIMACPSCSKLKSETFTSS